MKTLLVVIIILLFTCPGTFSQQKISITGSGSINYIPMKEFSNYLKSLSNSSLSTSVDKVSFGGSLKINYYLHKNHSLYLGADYLSSNASLAGGFAVIKWIFQTIPICIGYEYSKDIIQQSLRFYLGAGILYSYFEYNEKINSDIGNSSKSYKDNSWGFEIKSGIEKSIVEDISLIAELKYRYLGDYSISSYNDFDEVNLSGLGLLLGLMISVN